MQYSYMATNRAIDARKQRPYKDFHHTTAQANGAVSFFTASSAYDPTPSDYKLDSSKPAPGELLPSHFKSALLADLRAAQAPNLTLFIHGLGNTWDDAVTETAAYGAALQNGYSTTAGQTPTPPSDGTNRGVTIGFSWPSFNLVDSAAHYCAYHWDSPPERMSTPNIRANIIDSAFATLSLLSALSGLREEISELRFNVVCHSEGNYVLMLASSILVKPWLSGIAIDDIVLLAADVNRVALQQLSDSSSFDQGQGLYKGPGSAWVMTLIAGTTWVFFSGHDTTLESSNVVYTDCHNPDGLDRLGYSGPTYDQTLLDRVLGVNCSSVVHGGTSDIHIGTPLFEDYEAHWIPKHYAGNDDDIDSHSSYRYVPQILWATSQILNGGQAAGLYNISFSGASGTMTWEQPS